MRPIGFHLSLRLIDSRVIAPSMPQRRRLACAVLRVAEPHGLLAFRGSDSHLHLLVFCDRPELGAMLRAVKVAVHRALDPGTTFVTPPWCEELRRQDHLETAFGYVLNQRKHHGFAVDETHDASSLVDLLGLRVNGAFLLPRVREHLPRLTRGELLAILGVPDLGLGDDPDCLVEGASAALGLTTLEGGSQTCGQARRAFVQLASPRLSTNELATRLACPARTVRHLRHAPVEPAVLRAVALQAGFRDQLRRQR